MNNTKFGSGGNQGDSSYPVSPPLIVYTDANTKRPGMDSGVDLYNNANHSNRPSISLMPTVRNHSETQITLEEHERLSYDNSPLFHMGYNQPQQQLPPTIHQHQFNSLDNLLTDPLTNESRASFSFRNSMIYPLHQVPSIPIFPMNRDLSNSVDWGRQSVQLDLPVECDKDEAEGPKPVESPPFYSNYLHPSHSPIPYSKEEAMEGRKSTLSDMELKPVQMVAPVTPPFVLQPQLPRPILHPPSFTPEEKSRMKKERNKESARLSRKRKKQYQKDLDSTIAERMNELENERNRHLEFIQQSYVNQVNHMLSLSLDRSAYQQLLDIIGPKSLEVCDGNDFLWKELQTLCCPFYNRFILWIMSRNSHFFSRYNECIELSSGAKEISKDHVHKPSDFSGPFSFWPKFISYFDLSPEQEAKLRQIFLTEYQKFNVVSIKNRLDSPSMKIDKASYLISLFQNLFHRTMDEADELCQTVDKILSQKQMLVLLHFLQKEEQYAEMDTGKFLSRMELSLQQKQTKNTPTLCTPSIDISIDKVIEIIKSVE